LEDRHFLDTVTATGNEMARIEIIKLKWSGNLAPRYVMHVYVVSFRFTFHSMEQLRACADYYSRRTHPTSRLPERLLAEDFGGDWKKWKGWPGEAERWFERLPMYLLEEPKRKKVMKALADALDFVEKKGLLPEHEEGRRFRSEAESGYPRSITGKRNYDS
jgi:hypothetical protein